VVMINAMFVEMLIHPLMLGPKFDPTRRLRWRLFVTAAAIVGAGFFCWVRVRPTDQIQKPGTRAGLLHSTRPPSVKDGDREESNKQMLKWVAKYRDEKADLLVFPETSLWFPVYGSVSKDVGDLDLVRLYIRRDVPKGANEKQPETTDFGQDLRD